MGEVGKSQVRVDAFDKATGRTKYYEDLMPRNALYVRIKHAEIAHGFVKSVDTSAAEAIGEMKKRGCKHIKLMVLVAAPEGIEHIQKLYPDVEIYAGALDDHLNEHGYIVPGLGDAGDRIFGTK